MPLLRRVVPDVLILALLFLLPLGFFVQQTLGGRTLIPADNLYQYEPWFSYAEVVGAPRIPHNHLVSDLILENYQWKAFIRQQLAQGEVPLWNPHQFSGIPFLAAGQHSAFYPLSAVYYVLPLWLAYGWFTVLNLWLAGAFMYVFGRGLGIGRGGALLAGVVYQFGGFVIASVVFQMMIGGLPWLPLLLLMTEAILRGQPFLGRKTALPWVAIGAGALAMNVLAGHVEITIYTLLITGFYAGLRWLWNLWQMQTRQDAGSGRVPSPAPTPDTAADRQTVFGAQRETSLHGLSGEFRKAFWLLVMVVLGMGLSALQFVPLVEFAQSNWRAGRSSYETVIRYAHPTRDLVQFVLPNFYGSPAQHSYLDVFSGETVHAPWEVLATDANGNPLVRNHTEWGIKNYVEGALYLGILPLLLAFYALLEKFPVPLRWGGGLRERGYPPYRLIFAILALLSLSFMFGLPTYRMIYVLPGMNQLNSAFRWIFALTLAVAVLSAFGLEALLKQERRRLKTGLGAGLMALAALILLGLAGSYVAFPQIEGWIERVINSLAKAPDAFSGVRMFYSVQFVNVLIFAVVLLLAGAVFVWAGRLKRRKRLWTGCAVGLVAADLMIASWGFNPASDPALLEFVPPPVEWLREQYDPEMPFRYTTLQDPNQREILSANATMRYGLDDVRGYDSIIPASYVDYMRLLAPQVQLDFNRIAPLYTDEDYNHDGGYPMALDSPLLHLLNVRYIVTHPDVIVPFQEWEAVCCEDGAVTIWENPRAVPRAYRVAEGDLPTAWLTEAPNFYARNIIPRYEALRITQDTGREKFLEATVTFDSWLVISENYSDGWKAFLRPEGAGDDQEFELEVFPMAEMFQGMFVELAALQEHYTEVDLSPGAQAALDDGRFTVRMVYSPTSFQVGFFGSAISLVTLMLLLGIWFWRTYVGLNTEDSSQTAKVARNSVAPIILNLFNRGIDFVLAFVIYRLLSQEMVGVYNFAVVVFVWFDIFTNFGLDVFLIREVSRERRRSSFYFFNTSFLRFFLSLIGLGLLLLFLLFWQNQVQPLPQEGWIALLLLYVGLFPASLSKGMTSLYYAHEQAEKPAAIATITSLNKAVFGVLVLLLGWGIVGLAAVSIVNNVITLAVLIWAGRSFFAGALPRKVDFSLMRNMVNESYPLLLNHFLATIFFQIDIVIIQAIRGAVIVAQYSTAYKWLLALNIIPAFFTQALFPVLSRQASEDKASFKRTYRFGLKLLVAVALPVAVGFTVLAETLTLILAGPSYLPNGMIALQIMIWSIPIGWMNSLTQYALIALDLQRWITRAFFFAVAFNILSNALLIPVYGFRAAAVTTILSEAVLLVPFALLLHRGLGERLDWLALLWRPVLATGAMLGVVYVLLPVNMLLALIVSSAVYLVLLLALRPLDDHELAILRPMLPGRLRSLAWFGG